MPIQLPEGDVPFSSAQAGEERLPLFPRELRHVSAEGEEGEELGPETDEFYDSAEHEDMQEHYIRRFFLCEEMIEEVNSLRGLVRYLRGFADKMEQLAGQGWELELDDFAGAEGEVFVSNPEAEREQWRQRRQRRRAALTRDRPAHGSVDADMPDAQPAGQQPPGQLESRSGEVEEPPAAAAAAAGAGSERTLPKSPLASPAFASPAFALF